MKKILISIVFMLLVLTGCDSSQEGINEVENVPNNVQDKVDPDMTLQAITDAGEGYYIVFHSSGEVEADSEIQEDTLMIKLNETNFQEDNFKQYTYYLSTTPEYEVMEVYVNGDSTPFDNITVQ